MLVLSRKTRQQIRIGDNITVTILLVKGQVVRVGIEAPRDVRVLRAELPVFEEEENEKPSQRASRSSSTSKTAERTETPVSQQSAAVRRSAEDVVNRTSPGLLELRRRGSLASLTRTDRRSGAALGPLFDRH